MKTCFFIGHQDAPESIYNRLLEAVERHISEYGVTDFIVGKYGNFDRLAARAVIEEKRHHADITLTLLMPYYRTSAEPLPDGFDGSLFPDGLETVPKRAAKLGLEGVSWLNPRGKHLSHRPQVEWETAGLRACDVILFWIPAQAEPADKPYALPTRMELAENLARGKRIVLGIDPDVPYMRHAKFLAERYGVKKVHTTFEECLRALKRELARRKPAERDVDGPAWVAETLARHPVCVDDLARNQLLTEQWNRAFAPGDVVRVRGGLPVDASLLPLLNGDIRVE